MVGHMGGPQPIPTKTERLGQFITGSTSAEEQTAASPPRSAHTSTAPLGPFDSFSSSQSNQGESGAVGARAQSVYFLCIHSVYTVYCLPVFTFLRCSGASAPAPLSRQPSSPTVLLTLLLPAVPQVC